MSDIRARFEEIWPVPEGVYWMPLSRHGGEYMADPSLTKDNRDEAQFAAEEWDARLDTFTRCQETTSMYVGIIEELVYELETAYTAEGVLPACVDRAKQIIGRE